MPPAFDLIANPDRIEPAWGFYAIFFGAAGLLVAAAIATTRLRAKRFNLLFVFAPISAIVVIVGAYLDASDVFRVRELVVRGEFSTVEGCLESFHPGNPFGTKATEGDERWSVGGVSFSYGAGEIRPGYHLVEGRGGLVHANSRVRVPFVVSPFLGRKEIVRLQRLEPDCPAARDPG